MADRTDWTVGAVGQHCHKLATKIYDITRFWPSEEQYGLTTGRQGGVPASSGGS